LWNHFNGGEPEGNDCWYGNWYNTIGLRMAMGTDAGDQLKEWRENHGADHDGQWQAIMAFFRDNYTMDAWREFGRR
jgi:hypothetical protein